MHTSPPLPFCRVLLRHSNNSWYSPSLSLSLFPSLSRSSPASVLQPAELHLCLSLSAFYQHILSFSPDRVQDKFLLSNALLIPTETPRLFKQLQLCLVPPCASLFKSFVNPKDHHLFCAGLQLCTTFSLPEVPAEMSQLLLGTYSQRPFIDNPTL